MYRVLLISYYWPPAGGGGVQRWLKFIKYFREFQLEPIIYTPLNPDYPVIDESLNDEVPPGVEVWHHPIWEPYAVYRKFVGKPAGEKIYSGFISDEPQESLSQKISVFIRGNFFIPDARRFWIDPSVRYLSKRLSKEPVDLIISTGPPHSMHMIALGVVRKTGIPWIADFRDPWTGIDFYEKLRLTRWADHVHHRKERIVLRTASAVVTVSPYCVRHLEELSGRHVHLITNGYDEADFPGIVPLSEKFTITHVGSINPDRNPSALWQALETLLEEREDFRASLEVSIIGPADASVMSSLNKFPLLHQRVYFTNWLDHKEAIHRMRSARLLLLLLNDTPHTRGILSGKLFEYFGARRPVLCIGAEDGDAAALINACGAGIVADFADIEGMKRAVLTYFDQYRNGEINGTYHVRAVEEYARRNLVSSYSKLIDEVLQS